MTPDIPDAATLPPDFNAVTHFIDRHLAQGRGNRVAVVDRGGDTTYGALAERVNRAANLFRGLGLPPHSRVALALLDSVEFPTAFWGALRAGVVPVCLNTRLTTDHYRHILADCRARALVVEASLLPPFTGLLDPLPDLERVLVVGDATPDTSDWAARLAEASPQAETHATHRDDIAFWLYSSGSTGTPKGVLHRHASLYWISELYGQGVLGLTAEDRLFSAAKLFFAYGMGNSMTFPFGVGATAILHDGHPTPEKVLTLLERHQPTLFCGVPTLCSALLGHRERAARPGSLALRLSLTAGEPLPPEVGRRWEARFGTPLIDGVGSTEMLHIFLSNRPDDNAYGTSGRAVPGYRLRLVDAEGQEVPAGEIGELLVQGPSRAECYANQPAKSRATFVDGWTHTGDSYYRDSDGRYRYCGRMDDMFKSGGIWVSPIEVEAALLEHAAVREAAVVPRADNAGNLKPLAVVVLREAEANTALKSELLAFVRQRLESWKAPRWIEIVDALPRTASGKIQRFKLREIDRGAGT